MAQKNIEVDLKGGDIVTPDNLLTYKIYDGSSTLITSVGSANSNGNVSVSNGVATLSGIQIGNATQLKVSTIDEAGNESTLSSTAQVPDTTAPSQMTITDIQDLEENPVN